MRFLIEGVHDTGKQKELLNDLEKSFEVFRRYHFNLPEYDVVWIPSNKGIRVVVSDCPTTCRVVVGIIVHNSLLLSLGHEALRGRKRFDIVDENGVPLMKKRGRRSSTSTKRQQPTRMNGHANPHESVWGPRL